jgi:hypothetical protein
MRETKASTSLEVRAVSKISDLIATEVEAAENASDDPATPLPPDRNRDSNGDGNWRTTPDGLPNHHAAPQRQRTPLRSHKELKAEGRRFDPDSGHGKWSAPTRWAILRIRARATTDRRPPKAVVVWGSPLHESRSGEALGGVDPDPGHRWIRTVTIWLKGHP